MPPLRLELIRLTQALTLMTSFVFMAPAWSQGVEGTRDGGGGNASCAEYNDLVGGIAMDFKTLGQEKVSKANGVISVDELWAIKQAPLKCLPVEELDRQARSNPETKTTHLLWREWDKLAPYKKFRLALHELAVMARYERDGEYFVSDVMVEILKGGFQKYERLYRMRRVWAKEIVFNDDGTTTFIEPKRQTEDGETYYFEARPKTHLEYRPELLKGYNADLVASAEMQKGLCLYLGFDEVASKPSLALGPFIHWNIRLNDYPELKMTVAYVNERGHFVANYNNSYGDRLEYFNVITCKYRNK